MRRVDVFPITIIAVAMSACPSAKESGAPATDAATTQASAVAKVSAVPLGPEALLAKPPPEVEAQLAPPPGKGMARTTCVRFLPERVWFRCQYAEQRYGDKTGTFAAIGVIYEDGLSASLAYEFHDEPEPFDPKTALAKLGIVPTGSPSLERPRDDLTIWTWFNADARLRLHGQQYMLRVSNVSDRWTSTKVELLINAPLTATQQAARIDPSQPGTSPK